MGLVPHGAESMLGHHTAHLCAHDEDIMEMGTGFSQDWPVEGQGSVKLDRFRIGIRDPNQNPWRIIKHWSGLPRVEMESLSLEVFQA